jgi:hypothetical protein
MMILSPASRAYAVFLFGTWGLRPRLYAFTRFAAEKLFSRLKNSGTMVVVGPQRHLLNWLVA